jgi:large subunit ribosomal protein L24
MQRIKKGDSVVVVCGGCVGKTGSVLRVLKDKRHLIVGDVNAVVRHVRPDAQHPQGAFRKEMPIDISNVALVDPSTNKPGRVGFKLDESGKKVRYFKKSGVVL